MNEICPAHRYAFLVDPQNATVRGNIYIVYLAFKFVFIFSRLFLFPFSCFCQFVSHCQYLFVFVFVFAFFSVTRSLTRALKIIGLTLLIEKLPDRPKKIQTRRYTHPASKPTIKPSQRSARLHTIHDVPTETTQQHEWCVCRRSSFGIMIFCENPACPIKWFHMDCMGIQTAPVGDWLCPNCNNK